MLQCVVVSFLAVPSCDSLVIVIVIINVYFAAVFSSIMCCE